jgi:hypothetical protein
MPKTLKELRNEHLADDVDKLTEANAQKQRAAAAPPRPTFPPPPAGDGKPPTT